MNTRRDFLRAVGLGGLAAVSVPAALALRAKPKAIDVSIAVAHLRKNEWTMGNGQCHVCCGKDPDNGWWTHEVGHEPGCSLAEALESLGQEVEWEHDNDTPARHKSDAAWEAMFPPDVRERHFQAVAKGLAQTNPFMQLLNGGTYPRLT